MSATSSRAGARWRGCDGALVGQAILAAALSMAGCEQTAGTVVNTSNQAIFIELGPAAPRLYVAPGQSVTSDRVRLTGTITVFSASMARVQCAESGSAGARWQIIVSSSGDALSCIRY